MFVDSIILKLVIRLTFFITNVYAAYLMLRGHNAPGGGFIAGLVTSLSIILLNLSLGIDEIKRIIKVDPVIVAAIGLIMAYSTSLAPVLFNQSFLDHKFIHFHLPFFGEFHLGTPLLFDGGVFLVVVGVTTKIIFTLSYSIYNRKEFLIEETEGYCETEELPVGKVK